MTLTFKDNLYFLITISLFHIFFRILIYFFYLSENELYFSDNFILALSNENFLEYLFFQHSIPIGNIFFSKFIIFIAGESNLYLIFYLLNSFYTLSVMVVISKIYYLFFNKNSLFLLIVLLLTSISFLSYDTWRVDHYDHILVLFFFNFDYLFSNFYK